MTTGDLVGNGGARAEPSNGILRLDGVRVLVVESQAQVLELVVDTLGQCGDEEAAKGPKGERLDKRLYAVLSKTTRFRNILGHEIKRLRSGRAPEVVRALLLQ